MRGLITAILKRVRMAEPSQPPWGWPLAIVLIVIYLFSLFAGLLIVTTLQDDDLSNPQAPSIILGSTVGAVAALGLVYQYTSGAVFQKQESSKSYRQTPAQALGLIESQSRPLWIIWLNALAAAIVIDTISLVLGKPDNSLPLGLDRIDGATTPTWLLAGLLFVVLIPAVEELIFRGALYPVLAQRLTDNLQAVGFTALIFAGVYFVQTLDFQLNWQTTYWGLIYPLLLGCVVGIARAHSQSTLGAIGAHSMFGLFLILKTLLTFG